MASKTHNQLLHTSSVRPRRQRMMRSFMADFGLTPLEPRCMLSASNAGMVELALSQSYADYVAIAASGELAQGAGNSVLEWSKGVRQSYNTAAPGDKVVTNLALGPDNAWWFVAANTGAVSDSTVIMPQYVLERLNADGTAQAVENLPSDNTWLITVDSSGVLSLAQASSAVTVSTRTGTPNRLNGYVSGNLTTALAAHAQNNGLIADGVYLKLDNGQTFTGTLATFADIHSKGNAADYSATISIDGAAPTAAAVLLESDGSYAIEGTFNSTFGWHSLTVTILDGNDPSQNLSVDSVAYIIPPPASNEGLNLTARAGLDFSGTVAHYVGLDQKALKNYTVSINWGDGVTTAGQLIAGADGQTDVLGTHQYLVPGSFNIQISVLPQSGSAPLWLDYRSLQLSGNTNVRTVGVHSPVLVHPIFNPVVGGVVHWLPVMGLGDALSPDTVEAFINVSPGAYVGVDPGVLIHAIGGDAFSGALATFGPVASHLQNLRAVINWGDGTTPTLGTLRADAMGNITVSGNHRWVAEGSQSVVVRLVTDPSNLTTTVGIYKNSASVSNHLTIAMSPINATAGQPWTGTVGIITSHGAGVLFTSEFTTTINWGDGTTSTGQVVAQADGTYAIQGTHTFANPALDWPFGSSNLQWANNGYVIMQVQEARTWLVTAPSDQLQTSAWKSEHGNSVSVTPVLQGDGKLFNLSQWSPWVNSGKDLTFMVGALWLNPNIDPSAVQFSLAWDTGENSTVQITSVAGDLPGFYRVMATTNFASDGQHAGALTATFGTTTQSLTTNFYTYTNQNVTPPPPIPYVATGLSKFDLTASADSPLTATLLTFVPADPNAVADGLTATIYWGDDNSSETGTITANADGTFSVSGTHTYHNLGLHYVCVTLNELGYLSTYSFDGVEVTHNPNKIYVTGSNVVGTFRQREAFTAQVATFFAPAGQTSPNAFLATIDWGDGINSTANVIYGNDGTFNVYGTHTYATPGNHTLTINVDGPGGPAHAASTIAVIHNPIAWNGGGSMTQTGNNLAGTLGTFIDENGYSPDPTTDRIYHIALIDWGDGLVLQGTIVDQGDGNYAVQGSHSYATAGDYTMKVLVRRVERIIPGTPNDPGSAFYLDFSLDVFVSYLGISGAFATPNAMTTSARNLTPVGSTTLIENATGSWHIHISQGANGVQAITPDSSVLLTVPLGGTVKRIAYTQTDGTKVSVALTGLTAQLTLHGSNLASTIANGITTVTGLVDAIDVAIDPATKVPATSALTFTTTKPSKASGLPGNGIAKVGSITGQTLGTLSAGNVDLVSSGLSFTGFVQTARLHDLTNNADITYLGLATKPLVMSFEVIDTGSTITTNSAIGSFRAGSVRSGSTINAPSITSLVTTVQTALGILPGAGDFDATLNLTGVGITDKSNVTLGSMNIAGAINHATILCAGNIGTVTAARMIDSDLYAGVTTINNALPTLAGQFTTNATIASLTIRGLAGSPTADDFVNSNVAAQTLSRVSLKNVQLNNSGTQFGVVAKTIKSLTAMQGSIKYTWSQSQGLTTAKGLTLTPVDMTVQNI